MLGENAEAFITGLKVASEGGKEKSTTKRFGLLAIKQGLIKMLVGGEIGIGPGPGIYLVSATSSHDKIKALRPQVLRKLDTDGMYRGRRELCDPGSEGV